MPRCRAPNPCLPQQQDTILYVVKKTQSCAPEDGQDFVRNMLSWSWRSIKLLLLHLVGFYITLPSLMMHGQAQIKYKCVLVLATTADWNSSHFNNNWARYYRQCTEIFMYSLFLSDFNENLNFLSRFSKKKKNTHVSDFMKIRPVGAEFFHADGQTWRR